MSAVKTENLSKSFEHIQAVHSVDFDISSGELLGLIGPDGAGKTTLLRLLVGLLKPSSGKVLVEGMDTSLSSRKIKEIIGYMPQHFSLYSDLSVVENMKFFAKLYQVPKARFEERKAELLRFSALAPFQNRLARNLSGGMQKKLALSCNLFHTPKLLFLDEPTTGVDPVSRKELWDLLFALQDQGLTIVVSTPYMDEAQRCDRVAFMFGGRILALAKPDELLENFQNTVIEFSGGDQKIRTLLKEVPSLLNIYPYGGSLHMTFPPATDGVDLTESYCREKNIGPFRINRIDPSFEDFFLDLIHQQ